MERGHPARQCAQRTEDVAVSAKNCSRYALRRTGCPRSNPATANPHPLLSNLACDETASAFASAQRSAREEDKAQNDVNDVIHLAEHQQRADIEHMFRASAQEPAANTQQQIDESKK